MQEHADSFDILIAVCDADREIAIDAVLSFADGVDPLKLTLTIVDDGSAERVGDNLAESVRGSFSKVTVVRIDPPRGFRGGTERVFRGWKSIVENNTGEFVMKIDPDTLCIRSGFLNHIQPQAHAGLALGAVKAMRRKDAVAFLLDMFPVGLRRQVREGWIEKDMRPTRIGNVWWWSMGLTALRRGWSFDYAPGGCVIFPRKVVEHTVGHYLSRANFSRHGLITSEEDVLTSVATYASGTSFSGLYIDEQTAVELSVNINTTLEQALNDGLWVVHPIKRADAPIRQAWRSSFVPEVRSADSF